MTNHKDDKSWTQPPQGAAWQKNPPQHYKGTRSTSDKVPPKKHTDHKTGEKVIQV